MRPSPRGGLCALLALTLAGAAGCRGREPGPYPQAPIVLVSIDTLRADRLPAYGYAKGSTPALDALAREGILFERVVSQVPLTLPAHASLLTGLLPPRHGVRDNLGFTLRDSHPTLATRLRAAGRPTGAAVSAYVLRRATGIAAGFDFFDDELTVDAALHSLGAQQRDGAVAVEALGRWIESQREQPFFAFLHLYEPHTPYTPPEPFKGRFAADAYDGEVAYADELVGRLMTRLRALGLYERAVIVVTSDHGESLGEHGEQEHGFFLYRGAVEVPLLVRLPGGARGGSRVGGSVGLVDLAATLLELAGLPVADMDGISLRSALAGATVPEHNVYSETLYPRLHFGWSELVSVTDARFRFIRAPRPELYDLKADPAETVNLAPERASALAGMSAWIERAAGDVAGAAPEAVSPEVEEALRSLGYLGGGRAPQPQAGAALADPKDKIAVYEEYRRASGLRRQGQEAQAVAALRAVVEREPGMLDAWEDLGTTLLGVGREREGTEALDRVLKADPTRASAHLALARAYALAGRRELASRHATAAAAGEPGRAFEMLAELALRQGHLADAAEYARQSVAADAQRVVSHYVLGVVAQRAGHCEPALAHFERAAAARRQQRRLVVPGLYSAMGDCLARLGRETEAERAFGREIEQIPFSREGRVGLALLYRSQGRDAEAREALAGIVRAHPKPGADEYWVVVRTLAGLGDVATAREWAATARRLFPADPRFRG